MSAASARARSDRIAAKIDDLAMRFPRHRQRQAVRAHLLRTVAEASDEAIRRRLGHRRGDLDALIAEGRRLLHAAAASGLVTRAEMLAWLRHRPP